MGRIILGLLASLLVVSSLLARANALELTAIVPNHVGFTMQKSPVLYFFISRATSLPIRFTLYEDDSRTFRPVAEVSLKSPIAHGLQEIRLKDYNIVLELGVQYRWIVTGIQKPDSSIKDVVAGGVIERVAPDVVDYYGRSCDKDAVHLLREADIWYDAFACVTELIGANPQDRTLHDLRSELLGRRNYLYFP